VRRLEEELRKEHKASQKLRKSRQADSKPASSKKESRRSKSKPSQHQVPIDSESEDEQPIVEEHEMSVVDGGDDVFAQAAAEYAQQNPQEANLAAKKSSPFEAKGKQYISRRKRQQNNEQKMESAGTSDRASASNSTASRPNKQPANTGKMNALLADLSETEAVGRRQKKGNDSGAKLNSTAAQASGVTVDKSDDAPDIGETAPDQKGTKKKKPLRDLSNSASDSTAHTAGLGATKGVFDEVFAGESEDYDNQVEDAAPAQTKNKQKTSKSSPSPAPPRRQQSKRLAAVAASAAAAAAVTAELESSSEEEDEMDEMDEVEQVEDFDADDGLMQTLDDDDFNNDDDESDDDEDAENSNDDDEQHEIAAEPSEQRLSSFIQDMLDEDASQDPDNDENEIVRPTKPPWTLTHRRLLLLDN
jgi:hypothetical protein